MECKEQKDLVVLPVFYKVDPKEVRGGTASYMRGLAKHESEDGKNSKEMKTWKKALFDAGSLSGWTLNDGDDESELIQEIMKHISTRLGRKPLNVAVHPVGMKSRLAEPKSMLNLESKDDVLMIVVPDVDRGVNLIQDRLCNKRVLVILDDVDDLDQLHALAGKADWFGNGSRILVTTRDSHLLTPRLDWDHVYVYEVKAMDDGEARELLRKHAFPTYQKLESRTDLVHGFLNHAKGLPLALVVLGSLLRDTTEAIWESILKKLSKNLDRKINNVLKVSYDGLDEDEQEIFLHIACFFKGEKESIQRSKNAMIPEDVVLRLYEDVLEVLSRDMGDCAVKAIVLELPKPTEMCIGPNAFTKMRRLRLLIFRNDFRNLKYMKFDFCKSLVRTPDISWTPNLEELHIYSCENLVEAHESIADHGKLQVLDLRCCFELSVFPEVLKSGNLRELQLGRCSKLERFPDVPHKLEGLTKLGLQETAIKGLPASIENLVSLETISLCRCKNLISLPSSIYKLQNLKNLNAKCCTNLIGFPKFEDSDEPCMKTGLSNLLGLDLYGCNLTEVEFLENLSCCPILTDLQLRRNNIKSLPTSISKRDDLFILTISECPQLREIPELPLLLGKLDADNSESLQKNGHSTLMHHFVRRGLAMADISSLDQVPLYLDIFLMEGEMPEWVLPVEEGSVSFKASKDLYDKFIGLAFCFYVHEGQDRETHPKFEILPYVDGEMRNCKGDANPCWWGRNFMFLRYYVPSDLWDVVDFGQIDGNYVQFSLRVSTTNVKKWGLRIICKPLEDDLKAVLQNNWLMDPALLLEVVLESTDSDVESKVSSIKTDILKGMEDCQMSIEKHNQIVSKRNQKLMLPQGKQTKTMLTSNSADRDENGSVGLQLLLLE
ncbi:disease resistance protein RPV1-like [Rhodamnia argentea]|uniref:Disease resistance protein RPV1-like n=1 Tax=Rhodamnia argentea TaxID=178133 RepID=A0ABM3H4J4_9MYRT|nr:disease resistance protein RPV1-like [Rhodamnia argentea]